MIRTKIQNIRMRVLSRPFQIHMFTSCFPGGLLYCFSSLSLLLTKCQLVNNDETLKTDTKTRLIGAYDEFMDHTAGCGCRSFSTIMILREACKKNWIFYDNELISIATYPPYLWYKHLWQSCHNLGTHPPSSNYDKYQN